MHYGEKFNAISHFLGAVMALAGCVWLMLVAVHTGDPWKIVSFAVYSVMLLMLYVVSTLYHSTRGVAKDVLRKFDHCMIYLLIAGTYTPFTLVTLRGMWGWSLFITVWALALLGVAQELWLNKKNRLLSMVIYLLMGWLVLAALLPLIRALSWHGFLWLAAGGVLYTAGIAFYATDHKVRHGHGVWHLFVLAGSCCHYCAVLFYVA